MGSPLAPDGPLCDGARLPVPSSAARIALDGDSLPISASFWAQPVPLQQTFAGGVWVGKGRSACSVALSDLLGVRYGPSQFRLHDGVVVTFWMSL